jgi:molybdenum cofactor biosynthesis enzyme MoaA
MHPRSLDEARASRITDEVIKVLPYINSLKIAGIGEPFDSRHYMRILDRLNRKEHPNLQLQLVTNGLGLTEARLQSFSNRGMNLAAVQISIDAATKETYEKLRINGVFAELVGNLYAVSNARKRQKINRLAFSFVVQAANFREMKSFVSMGKEFGADEIRFEILDNWNVMGTERYSKLAVHQSDHPDFREFTDLISDPIFKQDGVALGALARLHSTG